MEPARAGHEASVPYSLLFRRHVFNAPSSLALIGDHVQSSFTVNFFFIIIEYFCW